MDGYFNKSRKCFNRPRKALVHAALGFFINGFPILVYYATRKDSTGEVKSLRAAPIGAFGDL